MYFLAPQIKIAPGARARSAVDGIDKQNCRTENRVPEVLPRFENAQVARANIFKSEQDFFVRVKIDFD